MLLKLVIVLGALSSALCDEAEDAKILADANTGKLSWYFLL